MTIISSLQELYSAHEGYVSDKWQIYLIEYNRLFQNIRLNPIRLLEVGIQNGGSLELWGEFFPHAELIVGCDINEYCEKIIYTDKKIKVVIGDIKNPATQDTINQTSDNFDIIIDDGSHTSSDIVNSFFLLFSKLNNNGIYIIEDLHCSYWHSFEGGLLNRHSSMSFLKSLTDIINHEHWGLPINRSQFLADFDIVSSAHNEVLLSEIHSIEFINSMCIIIKRSPEENLLGIRHVVGNHDMVTKNKHANGTYLTPIPQEMVFQNSPPEHDDKDEEIRKLRAQLAAINFTSDIETG